MWTSDQFAEHLTNEHGSAALWAQHLQPQMRAAVRHSLAAAAVRGARLWLPCMRHSTIRGSACSLRLLCMPFARDLVHCSGDRTGHNISLLCASAGGVRDTYITKSPTYKSCRSHVVIRVGRHTRVMLCCSGQVGVRQGGLVARAGSWELLGYDFVVDERMHVWLLEVNASPRWAPLSCSASICQSMLLSCTLHST